jgi:hypothetical protein
VVIEDIFDPEEFERQSNQDNIVRGIAPLNDMKTVPKIDFPSVQKLPKQSTAIFVQIP